MTSQPNTIYLKDYAVPPFLIHQVNLDFELMDGITRVTSRLHIIKNPDSLTKESHLFLEGEEISLEAIWLDDQPLAESDYQVSNTGLRLNQVPDNFHLKTVSSLCPEKNTALEGLYKSGDLYCTQCEAQGFRKITWFMDRPDVMVKFTTSITANKTQFPVMLSNGNLISSETLDNGLHKVTWQDPFPKPAYLFALVAGSLDFIQDEFITQSGRKVDLRIYVEAENIAKCDYAMTSLKHAMRWDETTYGREYDLDIYMIVAVNDFNMGAMENKGLNVFNAKFVLAKPDTATDTDFQGIEGVIAHEYFHNWTGNRITCRDWFQLSLKEGLTVFRDQSFSADMGDAGVKRIEDVRLLRAHQFAEDAGPMAHPIRPESYIEINNFYTVTVYEKGAEIVRMQRHLLGETDYRKATDLYFERHDGQAVTTEDFVQAMQDASGRDLTQFKRWYQQAGTPELHITGQFDQHTSTYRLHIKQTCPATPGQAKKMPFHIPIAIGLLNPQGHDVALRLDKTTDLSLSNHLLELTNREETFIFHGIHAPVIPSLLRGFSAPVKVHFDYTDDDLMFLMSHDSDGFNRWDAGQRLMQRLILNGVDDANATLSNGIIEAFRQALTDTTADKALIAEVLTIPSENYLGDLMEQVDVDGIHRARKQLRLQLAKALSHEFLDVYHDCHQETVFAVNHQAIGRRRLKNVCLSYLMPLETEAIYAICIQQYQAKQNMTDVMSALSLITSSQSDASAQLIADFYQQWQGDPLVEDKWLAVQALADQDKVLQQVKTLTQHACFSIRNPNKVRSLIGAFCANNVFYFHRIDGSGYQFLADQVIVLDALNPQVASRMVRLLIRWKRYDKTRQSLMKEALERIVSKPNLSNDVYEIVSKSLHEAV